MTAPAPSSNVGNVAHLGVGRWLWIMLSSICVATTTGLCARRHPRTICFCGSGNFATGAPTRQVAIATMTPSLASMIARRFSTPGLDLGHDARRLVRWLCARRRITISRNSLASSAEPAKLNAIQSTPRLTTKLASAVLVGQRRDGQHGVRHVDALRDLISPPCTVTQCTWPSTMESTCSSMLPSSMSTVESGFRCGARSKSTGMIGRVGRQVVGAFTHVDMHADQHDRLADRHRHGLRQPAGTHLGALQIGNNATGFSGLGGLAYQPGHARETHSRRG